MPQKKTLTILIPVYNGDRFIGGLLESFASFVETEAAGQEFLSTCEILVINNRSEDSTLDIARSYERRIKNLRVVTPETHVPSAEENVFRAFERANGEYTWVLGCDDIVRFEALPEVLQVARDGTYDMAVFNFMQGDQNGRIETVCNYYMKERVYESSLVSLTQRVGFWWLIAGFSGQIVRTSRVAGFDHAALVAKTSPIYSHVTAYLECLASRPVAIINIQNVIYRLSDNDIGHWRRAAARLGVFDEYFWTLGYVRQIKYLESRGVVGRDYLIKMVESNRDSFFRPTAMIYDKILSQLQIMQATRDNRNRMTRSEFAELVEFFEQRDLLARPFFTAVRKIFDSLTANVRLDESVFADARWRLQSYQSSYLLAPCFAGIEGDYEIYQVTNRHYAVHRLFRGALLDRIRYLDHVEQAPIVLEGGTRADVARRIADVGIGMELDSVPPSLMRYCSQAVGHGAQAWHAPRPAPAKGIVTTTIDSALSTDVMSALPAAQVELKAAYKARNPYVTRLTAWCTVLGIKIVRRLSASRQKRLSMNVATSAAPFY